MKKELTIVVLFDVVFIFFLALSGFFNGILESAVYYLAFIVPIFFAIALARKMGISSHAPKIKMNTDGILLTACTAFPLFALVFFVSWLTSLVLGFFGASSNATDVSGNIISAIFTHALLTAVCEELLFRYVPITYLAPYSKRVAVLASALFFSLVHCNFFQLPYAFIAGVVFAVLDIASDSILPSFLLHFSNNIISVIWVRGEGRIEFVRIYIIILVSLAVISLIPAYLLRKRYASFVSVAFDKGCLAKGELGYSPAVLILLALTIALVSI